MHDTDYDEDDVLLARMESGLYTVQQVRRLLLFIKQKWS
jgi:hypothetical protein